MEKENNFSERISNAMDDLKEYLNLRLRLIQLNMAEKISIVLAKLVSSTVAILFFILFFLFGSFALAYWLSDLLNSYAKGFAVVAGFYLLIALIILVFARKPILRALTNSFIRDFANERSNHNSHE